MTTRGDGLFEVHRDLTEFGYLAQIRIEMEPLPTRSDTVQPNQTLVM